ncbi:hypothetical protein MUK42_16684 [Musa troglodytarum]|uniref:D-aminoacyl-tRNA deacylase n=1 Tax=Musa troglodytarum TaxID=320322 RepID=A0A9E7HSD6_9LILI|nr:hypothetical protein MUK42_16684 [Musa troglodytarum]URE38791.1 hypothetical protein MUK42_16684 [Musa troglodytarum]
MCSRRFGTSGPSRSGFRGALGFDLISERARCLDQRGQAAFTGPSAFAKTGQPTACNRLTAQGYTIVQAAPGGGGGRAMRAVVQRVLSASVEVEGRVVSEIGPGLLVLVGVHESDTDADADYICRKVLNMRLFSNSKTGKAWDLSVKQSNFGVLLVSQFTLYGILKGNKPDFHVAMPPQKAKPFYESLVEKFRKSYTSDAVKDVGLCCFHQDFLSMGTFPAFLDVISK